MSSPSIDALTKVSAQELKRAGLGIAPKQQALSLAFENPMYDMTPEDAPGQPFSREAFRGLLKIGDPDTPESELAPAGTSAGMAERIARNFQLRDFKGRGWSNDEIKAYESKNGPLPPMILSEGGQQADQWRNNREFVDRYLDLAEHGPKELPGQEPGWAQRRTSTLQDAAANQWQAKEGRQYGESGWAGALENPEYTAGWLMSNLLDPISESYSYGRLDRDGEKRGGWLGALLDDHPKYRSLKAAANKVDPILPGNPKGRDEKEAARRQLLQAAEDASPRSKSGASAYDMYYRNKYGEYPSYAGSTIQQFSQDLMDPTVLLGGMGAKGVSAIGRALLREGMEEIPMAMAIGGGITAHNEMQQARLPKDQQKRVNFGEMFTPGVRDELPDENREQFGKRYNEEADKRTKALDGAPALLEQIPGAVQRPSYTPYGKMMPRMTIAR